MATRFYFQASGASAVNPAFDAGWEQQGQATRLALVHKLKLSAVTTLAAGTSVTVPITTTQDILDRQYVSEPLRRMVISGTVSLVIRTFENATTNNATLAVVVKLVSRDGGTLGSTLFSAFGTDTEYPLSGSDATRIVNAQAITQATCNDGDRIIVEIGVHATGPTAAGSATHRYGTSAATDFALTTALTTDLNPWVEFSADLFPAMPSNYQFIEVGDGMSTTERIR